MPLPFRTGAVAVTAVLGLLVAGCGSDDSGSAEQPKSSEAPTSAPSETPTATEPTQEPAKPKGTTIDITFKGGKVTPDGVVKKVEAGKPFTLHVVADEAGELHVHSSPEQEIAYPAGTSDHELTIDKPGVVEVESHDLHQLVVQLQVR